MKSNVLRKIVISSLVVSVVLTSFGCGKTDNGTVSDDVAFRTAEEIEGDEVIFLDEDAIALAESVDSSSSAEAQALRQMAQEAFNLVNEQRAAAGLSALTWDGNLESAAGVRAKECASSFSHTRPSGQAWYTVNSQVMGGENLAHGYSTATNAMNAWMNSPTHKENILYPTFTKMSIAIYTTPDGDYYWAQEFGY